MDELAPLILTAVLDEGAFAWFDDLRRAHFPAHRNRVPAHLTLFHALPGERERQVVSTLERACEARAPMTADVRGPWSIGRGVAYRLASEELAGLRADLAATFAPWLKPQDRAPFRPHITVQNKVDPAQARLLLETLQLEFEPFEIALEGVHLWRYLRGPWQLVATLPFAIA